MAGTVSIHASSTPWIPEDDLLLKNSIEAGASLEALAKGAVQFSRGYTLRELRDRWHSLLYDPDVSSQASSRMMELELSGSNSSSKLNKSDGCKNAGAVAKRKIISIRRQYNAMRKKLRTELFNSNDIGFLEPNLHDCNGRASDFQEHVNLDNGHGATNCMLRGCISDHFGLQDSDFDILHHAFPQAAGDIGTTTVDDPGSGYQIECQNPIDDNPSITNVREDSLYGFPENIPRLIGDDGRGSFESDIDQRDASQMLPDDSMNFENFTNTNTLDPLQKLPNDRQLEADDSLMKRSPAFHSMNDNPQNMGSGFGGRHINSPDSDGNASLHAMGFSSPMPRLPLWKTMEDISVPDMPIHINDRDITRGVEEALTLPDNSEHRGESPAGFDVVHSEPLLGESDSGNCFSSGVVSEGEFVDLSDSLLNFPNEDELLFMDVDGKDQMDTSCYDNVNSLITSSPIDTKEGVLCDIQPSKLNDIEAITTLSSTRAGTISSSLATDSMNSISSLHDDGQQGILDSETNVASTSMLHPDSPQLTDETICCVLNTEDTEIPCNDDIFLLIHPTTSFAPSRKPFTVDRIEPASSVDEKDNERRGNLMKKVRDPAQKVTRPSATVPNKLPESFPGLPVATCKVKSEVPDTKSSSLHPGEVRNTIRDLTQSRSAIATTCTSTAGVVEKNVIKAEPGVLHNPSASRELVLFAEAGTVKVALPETVSNPSASEQDESESENDVPYFSDIEAMILEMDLGPYGQDSYTTKQVSKYQNEDAKKKIIRLEQCARSSLQRTMSSHGALAFLYGRHLKYYMKKTEVLIGRSTDDVDVDIDLRKEGRANKISRRQATIKMEADGAFLLKNLGKSSISVNGKAVASEQSLCLSSSSLIEIKGMSFVFEINPKYVSLYLDSVRKKSQYNKSKLEHSP